MTAILVRMSKCACGGAVYARARCRKCYDRDRYSGAMTMSKRKGRSPVTHCIKGHEYTEENTYWQRYRNGSKAKSCLTCRRDSARSWRKSERGALMVERRRAKLYGISVERLREIEARGACEICGATESQSGARLHIDHSHATGDVRGLLCHGCNGGLGLFRDDPEIMARAIRYLSDRGVAP